MLGVSLPGGFQGGGQPGAPGAPGQASGPPRIFKEEVRIVADEVTNSLVILASKRDYQLIVDVLRRIDVVPRQVVLEVLIAEVVLNKSLEFGVSYAITEGKLAGLSNTTATVTGTVTADASSVVMVPLASNMRASCSPGQRRRAVPSPSSSKPWSR